MATVLVVDDQPEVRDLLAAVTKKAGHRVLLAADAAEAWKQMHPPPGLIFADIDMPGETGVEFVLRLRENPEFDQVPVVFCTAYRERAAPLMASGAGVIAIIDKPFRMEHIRQVLEQQFSGSAVSVPAKSASSL